MSCDDKNQNHNFEHAVTNEGNVMFCKQCGEVRPLTLPVTVKAS